METMIAAISTAGMMTSGRYMKPNSSQKWSSMTRRNVRAGRLTGSPPVPAGFGVDAGVPGNSHTAALGRVGACTIGDATAATKTTRRIMNPGRSRLAARGSEAVTAESIDAASMMVSTLAVSYTHLTLPTIYSV